MLAHLKSPCLLWIVSLFGTETCDTSKIGKRWLVGRWIGANSPLRSFIKLLSFISDNFHPKGTSPPFIFDWYQIKRNLFFKKGIHWQSLVYSPSIYNALQCSGDDDLSIERWKACSPSLLTLLTKMSLSWLAFDWQLLVMWYDRLLVWRS